MCYTVPTQEHVPLKVLLVPPLPLRNTIPQMTAEEHSARAHLVHWLPPLQQGITVNSSAPVLPRQLADHRLLKQAEHRTQSCTENNAVMAHILKALRLTWTATQRFPDIGKCNQQRFVTAYDIHLPMNRVQKLTPWIHRAFLLSPIHHIHLNMRSSSLSVIQLTCSCTSSCCIPLSRNSSAGAVRKVAGSQAMLWPQTQSLWMSPSAPSVTPKVTPRSCTLWTLQVKPQTAV